MKLSYLRPRAQPLASPRRGEAGVACAACAPGEGAKTFRAVFPLTRLLTLATSPRPCEAWLRHDAGEGWGEGANRLNEESAASPVAALIGRTTTWTRVGTENRSCREDDR